MINLYHKKQRWKIALLGVAILLVALSMWFSFKIVAKVQQRELDRIHQWAENIKRKSELVHLTNRAFDELSDALAKIQDNDFKTVELWVDAMQEVNRPLDDYSFVVKILSRSSNVPMIVTDMNENVVSGHNFSQLDSAMKKAIRDTYKEKPKNYQDSVFRKTKKDTLKALIPIWKENHPPIIMDLYRSDKQKVFYFDSIFFKSEELGRLKKSRDSLIEAFSNELITNEFLVPVLFVDVESRNIISTNMPDFDTIKGPLSASALPQTRDSIMVDLGSGNTGVIYYKHSPELIQMRFFPFVQFFIIGLFILIAYLVFNTFRKAEQDQVWVGMAKETAHQLGTPISSLMAWNELLKNQEIDQQITDEIDKDIDRLNTVTNRFSKIGSEAALQQYNLEEVVARSINYLKHRISSKVNFEIQSDADGMQANINPPLIEWVIENIVKNAVDAMEGVGNIQIYVHPFEDELYIDITDNGKGIPANKIKTVFRPGYTTKKRGWGLGLSLVKRIVEDFHKGKVFVLKSDPNEGTTFRIVLKQA